MILSTHGTRTFRNILMALAVGCCICGVVFFAPVGLREASYVQWKQEVATAPNMLQEFCANRPEDDASLEICIPALRVRAPVVTTNSIELTDVHSLLKDGVVHLAGTAMPGSEGNGVFFGHSDDYPWSAGQYKTIFSTLDKLKNTDDILFLSKSTSAHYKVTHASVVSARDLSILTSNENKKTVTLVTCWPKGTTWKRLVVVGEGVSVKP